MFVKRAKSKQYEYLYLVEEVKDEAGIKHIKILERFGRADLLTEAELQAILSKHPKQIKYEIAQLEGALAQPTALLFEQLVSDGNVVPAPLTSSAEDNNTVTVGNEHSSHALSLHYGHLLVKQVWHSYLHLDRSLNYLQETRLRPLSFNLSTVACFLAASKMMAPSSYLRLWENREIFLASPAAEVNLDQFYEVLGLLCQFKDHIVKSTYRNVRQSLGFSKPLLLFFDCTNFYFETPYDSKEEFVMKYQKRRARELQNEGKSSEEITAYLQTEQFAAELKRELDFADKAGLFMRMRGPSKEGRFAKPIMGMSLVIDERGFPLDFEIFPGNKSEYGYLKKAVESIKEKYGISDAFYTADRGLNSSLNLEFIQNCKLGFIVAQKISQQKPAQRKEMLSKTGWKKVNLSTDPWIVQLLEDDDGAAYKYKVCDHKKVSYELIDGADGKTHRRRIEVKCKIMYTFSKKRKQRDLCVLDAQIAKAQEAIKEGKFVTNPNGSGWRSLVLTNSDKEKKGGDKEKFRIVSLDDEKIERLKEIAGYAALVYSLPQGNVVANMTEEEAELVAQKGYKQLVAIEDCFRTAKSTLNLRPVFLKTNEHTIGHCVLCILALTMLKLIQYNLKQMGVNMPLGKIQLALSKAIVTAIPSAVNPNRALFINALEPSNDLENIGKRTDNEIKAHSAYSQLSSVDLLLTSLGLKPLRTMEKENSLRLKLKISPHEQVLTSKQRQTLRQLAPQLYD